MKTKTLLIAASCVLSINCFFGAFSGGAPLWDGLLHNRVAVAQAIQKTGKALTDDQKADLQAWEQRQQAWRPSQQVIQADLTSKRSGYIPAQIQDVPEVKAYEKDGFYGLGFCDVLGMMLLGMALLKNGFLAARLSYRTYLLTAAIAGLISVSTVSLATWKAWSSGFDMLTSERWLFFTMEPGRVSGAIAIAAMTMLVVKARLFPWLVERIAAIGQTALSNYILTSLFCKFIFVWGPWKLYDRLEYYQLYYIVGAAWICNLAWSKLWLQYFRFGPLEWLWRSLTYWKMQPMRLRQGQESAQAVVA